MEIIHLVAVTHINDTTLRTVEMEDNTFRTIEFPFKGEPAILESYLKVFESTVGHVNWTHIVKMRKNVNNQLEE
jgi:hypothetical protein